jgi:hypothetical protein
MWYPITEQAEPPSDRDLRLAVIERDEVHALREAARWRSVYEGSE